MDRHLACSEITRTDRQWRQMNDQINRQTDKWMEYGWSDEKPKERMSNIDTIKTEALISHTTNGK